MNENTIESLKEALKYSPENAPLRLLLAENLLSLNRLEEAEAEYSILLKSSDDLKIKVGLAKVYYKKGNYSACNVILEEMIEMGSKDLKLLSLYAKALLKEDELAKALEIYQKVLAIDPQYYDEELDSALRLRATTEVPKEEEDEDMAANKPITEADGASSDAS